MTLASCKLFSGMALTGCPEPYRVSRQNNSKKSDNRCADAIDYISRRKCTSVGIGILLFFVLPIVGLLLAYGQLYHYREFV